MLDARRPETRAPAKSRDPRREPARSPRHPQRPETRACCSTRDPRRPETPARCSTQDPRRSEPPPRGSTLDPRRTQTRAAPSRSPSALAQSLGAGAVTGVLARSRGLDAGAPASSPLDGVRDGRGSGARASRRIPGEPDAVFSISATTRAPRGAERDGVDYHFVTPERFASATTWAWAGEAVDILAAPHLLSLINTVLDIAADTVRSRPDVIVAFGSSHGSFRLNGALSSVTRLGATIGGW